jgi:hypothetical protein
MRTIHERMCGILDFMDEQPNAAQRRSRAWRDFEKLVAQIEQSLGPHGVTVKSPDHIQDLVTGKSREVDASLRYQVGSVPVLITVECRQRSRAEDVTWIEQLAKKRDKLGAVKTIAVSSKHFSEEATRTADISGIELRCLSEITLDDIKTWWSLEFIEYQPPTTVIRIVEFFGADDRGIAPEEIAESEMDLVRNSGTKAKIIHSSEGSFCPADVLESWQKLFAGTENDLTNGVSLGADSVRKSKLISLETGRYWLSGKAGKVTLEKVGLRVDVQLTVIRIPKIHAYRYSSPDGEILEGIEFLIPEFDGMTKAPLRVRFQKGPEYGFKLHLNLGGAKSETGT